MELKLGSEESEEENEALEGALDKVKGYSLSLSLSS